MTSGIKENLQVKNTKQTVVTHSHPTAKDQVGTISSDESYTIADVSFQFAQAQQSTNQPQETEVIECKSSAQSTIKIKQKARVCKA